MTPEPRVIKRDFEAGDWTCGRCGERFHLFFNGGELDRLICKCGRIWQQRARGYDLMVTEGEDAR